jgi:hypothetical protein
MSIVNSWWIAQLRVFAVSIHRTYSPTRERQKPCSSGSFPDSLFVLPQARCSFVSRLLINNMLRHIPGFLVFILLPLAVQAQVRLSGRVTDQKGQPVPRASVYLDNTLDGTSSDSAGNFSFSSSEKGAQYLVASAVGYQQVGTPLELQGTSIENISLTLKAAPQSLEGVTVTAGAFEAGADKNKAVLTTLDIITTAGTQADVVRAIQTLPVRNSKERRRVCLYAVAMRAKRR